MAYHVATIEILVDVDDESEASDLIADTLREHLREFAPGSAIIDWRYQKPNVGWQPHDGDGFEYA